MVMPSHLGFGVPCAPTKHRQKYGTRYYTIHTTIWLIFKK